MTVLRTSPRIASDWMLDSNTLQQCTGGVRFFTLILNFYFLDVKKNSIVFIYRKKMSSTSIHIIIIIIQRSNNHYKVGSHISSVDHPRFGFLILIFLFFGCLPHTESSTGIVRIGFFANNKNKKILSWCRVQPWHNAYRGTGRE